LEACPDGAYWTAAGGTDNGWAKECFMASLENMGRGWYHNTGHDSSAVCPQHEGCYI
jgi:hypothetical protein